MIKQSPQVVLCTVLNVSKPGPETHSLSTTSHSASSLFSRSSSDCPTPQTPLPPPGDPSSQGLVLSKLCQPRNDLQQRAVSLLIRRPSLWPPPLCLGIPLPHHLPDPPRFHLSCSCPPPNISSAIHPSPWVLLSVPAARVAGWCLRRWRQPIRVLTSSVSRTWLTGRPQRLPATIRQGGWGRVSVLPKWMLLSLTITVVGNWNLL